MKIKVNGNPYFIKPLSKLTFDEFNSIMVKGECTDLQSYLSLFIDIPINEFMGSEMKGAAIPALAEYVFDVDPQKVVKDKKETIEINGTHRSVSGINTVVGQDFLITIVNDRLNSKEINEYEHSLWVLAIGLLEGDDIADINKAEEYYKDLCSQEWVKVLPQAFFLLKRTIKPRINMWRQSIAYILGLKKINIMIRIYKKSLKSTAVRVQYNFFVRYLTKTMKGY